MRQMEFRRVRRRWPGVTSQLLYMTCRAFMRRNEDLPGFRYTSSCPSCLMCALLMDVRHPSATVIMRRERERASKDARPRLAATVALRGPRFARAPQGDGQHESCSTTVHISLLSPSHHLSFPRGVRRADHLVSLCRPRTRGAAERREAHTGSSITLARRDAALTARGDPGATGIAPLGAPPWRFPAAGPRFNSGSVHRIHVATCPPARSQDLADWVPDLPRRGSLPSATGRHAPLRL